MQLLNRKSERIPRSLSKRKRRSRLHWAAGSFNLLKDVPLALDECRRSTALTVLTNVCAGDAQILINMSTWEFSFDAVTFFTAHLVLQKEAFCQERRHDPLRPFDTYFFTLYSASSHFLPLSVSRYSCRRLWGLSGIV